MLLGLRRKIGRYAAPIKEEASFAAADKPTDLTPYEDAAWTLRKKDQDLRRLENELTQFLTQVKVMCSTMATVGEVFSDTCSDDEQGRCVGVEYKQVTTRIHLDEAERLEQSIRFTVLDPLKDRLEHHTQLLELMAARDKLEAERKMLREYVARLPTLRLEDDDKRAQTYSRLDKVIGVLNEEEKQLLPQLEDAIHSDAVTSTENLFNTLRLHTSIFFAHASQSLFASLSPAERDAVTESTLLLKPLAAATKLSKVSSLTSDGWTDMDGSNSSTAPDGVEVLEGSEEDEEFNGSPITVEDFEAGRMPLVFAQYKNISSCSTHDTAKMVCLASFPVVPSDNEEFQSTASTSDEEWNTVERKRRSTSPTPTNRVKPITPRRSSSMFWSLRKSIRGRFSYSSGESRILRQNSAPVEDDSAGTTADLSSQKNACVVPQTRAEWEAIEACLWEIDARDSKSPAKPFLAADPAGNMPEDLLSRLLQEHEPLCLECISYLSIEDLARLSKVSYGLHSHLLECVSAWKKCIRSGGLSDATRTSLWLSVFYESTPWRSNGIASHHLSADRRRNMYDQLLANVGMKLDDGLLTESSPSDEDTQLLVWFREIDVDVVRTCHRRIYSSKKRQDCSPHSLSTTSTFNNVIEDSVQEVLREMVDRVVETDGEEISSDSVADIDTTRTLLGAPNSELEAKIRRVLRAYVLYNPRVGYCQGMGFLVRLLAEVTEDEADIFWLFVGFSEPENDRNLYEPGMAVLQPFLSKFELLFSTHMPELYTHFQAEGVHVATFCTRWFLTFFSSSQTLTPELVVRLLDIFVVDGWRIIFSVSLVILDELRDQLMRCDLEGIIRVLQFPRSYMPDTGDLHQRQLIRHALAFSISHSINSI